MIDNKKIKSLLFFMLGIGALLFFAWIVVGIFMGVKQNHVDYYKDDNNYEEVICVLSEHEFSKEIGFKVQNGEYAYSDYLWLWEKNKVVVSNSDFWEEVTIGDVVTVITAPGYFWDGYEVPIVALKTESKIYLDFETGKENQVAQLQEMRTKYLSVAIPIISISATCIFFATVSGTVLLIKNKKRKVD